MRWTNRIIVALAASSASAAMSQEVVAGHKIIRGNDAKIWAGAVDSGPLTHLATQSVFPEKIGEFQRFRLMAIDDGLDVVVNYEFRRKPHNVIASVFLFQPEDLPEHKLKGAITAIGLVSPETFLWSDGPFTVYAPRKLRLFKGTYKTGIGPDTVMDYLYFGQLGKWTVKIRATLPSPQDVKEEVALDGFVRALPWAAIEAANGSCTGSACDSATAMAFNSHTLEGMLGRLVAMMQAKSGAPRAEPLFALKQGGDQWRVTALDAKLEGIFSSAYGAVTPSAPMFTLVRERQGKPEIVRFFSGAPTEEQFKSNVDGLVKSPEDTPFISPAKAAAYQPD